MRLIDADELKKQFEDRTLEDFTCYHFIEAIDNSPTVELQMGRMTNGIIIPIERPTGEWKCFIGSAYYGVDEDGEPIWRGRKIYHCPFCNRRTVIKENYCPNCGAKMKGEENND